MALSKWSTHTLEEIAATHAGKLLNEKVVVFDVDAESIGDLRLNYPCKGDFIAVILVVSGTAEVKVDFETAELEVGSLVSTFPHNIFEFVAISSDCHIQGILLSVKYMSELQFRIDAVDTMGFLSNTYSKFIPLDQETFASIKYHLNRLAKVNRVDIDNYFNSEIMQCNVITLFYELANYGKKYFNSQKKKVFSSLRKEDIAVHFVGMVAKYSRQHRDVMFYAEQLHVSRKHLTKVIKDVYGLTPKQIIDGKVIAEAKVMLQKSEMNIGEIMNELNFHDQAVFSKFFKKNTGMSPFLYRHQMANFSLS